jgi:hypothetical protein
MHLNRPAFPAWNKKSRAIFKWEKAEIICQRVWQTAFHVIWCKDLPVRAIAYVFPPL